MAFAGGGVLNRGCERPRWLPRKALAAAVSTGRQEEKGKCIVDIKCPVADSLKQHIMACGNTGVLMRIIIPEGATYIVAVPSGIRSKSSAAGRLLVVYDDQWHQAALGRSTHTILRMTRLTRFSQELSRLCLPDAMSPGRDAWREQIRILLRFPTTRRQRYDLLVYISLVPLMM